MSRLIHALNKSSQNNQNDNVRAVGMRTTCKRKHYTVYPRICLGMTDTKSTILNERTLSSFYRYCYLA